MKKKSSVVSGGDHSSETNSLALPPGTYEKRTSEAAAPEGPPTLRECREALCVLHSFYSRNVVNQRHLKNVGFSENILSRLTDEALERDEKRTAALEELWSASKSFHEAEMALSSTPPNDVRMRRVNYRKMTASKAEFDVAYERLDALTPAPKEKEIE